MYKILELVKIGKITTFPDNECLVYSQLIALYNNGHGRAVELGSDGKQSSKKQDTEDGGIREVKTLKM